MSDMNRIHCADNPYQGAARRVLCVCSAGLLRSPTAARILAHHYDYNTRAAGVHSYALVKVDKVLLHWAQEIVCMTDEHVDAVYRFAKDCDINFIDKKVMVLGIPDNFAYMDSNLIELIKERYRLVSA